METTNNKLEQDSPDLNKDGVVTPEEYVFYGKRLNSQKQLAWLAMLSMIAVTVFMLTTFVEGDRIKILNDLLWMFYICQVGVIGTYVGFTTLVNKK